MSIMKRFNYFYIILFLLTSCQNSEDAKLLSQLIGASIGAAVGSNYGDGMSKNIYTIIGTAGGYLIGGKIAELLTEEEEIELNKTISDSLKDFVNNFFKDITLEYLWGSKTVIIFLLL